MNPWYIVYILSYIPNNGTKHQIHGSFYLVDCSGTSYAHLTDWELITSTIGVGAGLPACGPTALSLYILVILQFDHFVCMGTFTFTSQYTVQTLMYIYIGVLIQLIKNSAVSNKIRITWLLDNIAERCKNKNCFLMWCAVFEHWITLVGKSPKYLYSIQV